jgi:hypothetical protein
MTPAERQMVVELFDRLAALENTPRDPEAERLIAEGLNRAPHAVYALVQTTLLQGEALKAAEARLAAQSDAEPTEQPSFLDTMRDTLFGGRGAAPAASRRPMGLPPGLGTRPQPEADMRADPRGFGGGGALGSGGSFLGTAAAAAVGVIGGSLLMNSVRSMLGGEQGQAQAATGGDSGADPSPWGNRDSELSREAGVNDLGREQNAAADDGSYDTAGLADDDYPEDYDDGWDAGDSDFG